MDIFEFQLTNMQDFNALINKYNQAVPRYTSYPTVPFWYNLPDSDEWKMNFRRQFEHKSASKEGLSMYLHLPFCESLCTYCACNKKITTNHAVEEKYIAAILKEWSLYKDLMHEKPLIKSIHLGGGTPTFFSSENLRALVSGLLNGASVAEDHAFSLEGHPNNTTIEQLQTLYDLGFRRISYGVQDNDPVVQKAINRIQPLENVKRATENARSIGFESVNFDLIYGLPFQTLKGEEKTIEETTSLRPDRVAFYSYAHVPWKQKVQRLFDEHDLPSASLKTQLYLTGKKMFTEAGYTDIGMDHFALPNDELYKAREHGTLHRNFMGYTDIHSNMLIGLGVSAISDIGVAYAQNHKELELYYRSIEMDELPVTKGYFMCEIDMAFKQYILQTICEGKTRLQHGHKDLLNIYTLPMLREMEKDGLLELSSEELKVTKTGFQFVRNICKAFDIKWLSAENSTAAFSKAV